MRASIVWLFSAVAACPSGFTEVSPGREFELELHQAARMAGSGESIRFEAVEQDSRCPMDVTCVWAGNALVRLRLKSAGCDTLVRLNTDLEPRAGAGCAIPLEIRGLKPLPRSNEPPGGRAYRVSLLVPAS